MKAGLVKDHRIVLGLENNIPSKTIRILMLQGSKEDARGKKTLLS